MNVSYVNHFRRGLLLCAVASIAALGCSKAPDPARKPSTGREQVLRYGDRAGSTSRVDRTVAADGTETLHGESEIASGASITRIVEDATIAADGRLVRAEVAVSDGCGDRPTLRATFDPRGRVARVAAPSGEVVMPMPDDDDAPWAYLPVAAPSGESAATPVAAWVTYRASRAAGARGVVRLVDARARRSVLSPLDQIAAQSEVGTTVVMGWDAADVGAAFVDRVRLTSRGIALGLVNDGAGPALACRQVAHDAHTRVE